MLRVEGLDVQQDGDGCHEAKVDDIHPIQDSRAHSGESSRWLTSLAGLKVVVEVDQKQAGL